jgi:uncharacterized cupin superfamily protein
MSQDEKKPALLSAAEIRAREEAGNHPWNPSSAVVGTRLGTATGLKLLGINIIRIAPGRESFIYHSHRYEEEWIYILSGRGIAEIDGSEHEVGPGDFMGFAIEPQPVAHHLRNPFAEELVYLCGSNNSPFEVADYPKLERRLVRYGASMELYKIADGKPPFPPLDE